MSYGMLVDLEICRSATPDELPRRLAPRSREDPAGRIRTADPKRFVPWPSRQDPTIPEQSLGAPPCPIENA